MELLRVSAKWTGFSGAPGYSNFHFAGGGGLITDAQQVADRVRAGIAIMLGVTAPGVTIQVINEVERLDADTGTLLGSHQVDSGNALVSTGTGSYSAASGACVNWRTNDYRNGRRIRGRTFVVPMSGSMYDTTGTLSTGALTALNNFASEIRGTDLDSEFGVWSRPVGGAGGVFATCTGHSVPDKAAVLRSRRD